MSAKDLPAPANAAKAKKPQDETDYELEGLMSEIETDLREDEFKKIWQKYGAVMIVFVVALLAGVAGFQFYHQREAAHHDEVAHRYEAAVKAHEDGKTDDALAQFTALAKDGDKGYSTLAQLSRAAILVEKKDTDGALAIYKALAADSSADPVFRDTATLLRVLHSLDRDDPKILEAALAPLVAPGNGFNASARELTALLAAKQGDPARAAKILDEITADSTMPQSMRDRAADLTKLYQAGGMPPPPAAPALPAAAAPAAATPAPASPPPAPATTRP